MILTKSAAPAPVARGCL